MATMTAPRTGLEEAASRIGDRWTLLIVDALLRGPRKFNELLDELPGLASNVLSKRLRHLEDEGVVVATAYSKRPPRFSYQLTSLGAELAGALRLLTQWGHQAQGAEGLHHDTCGTELEVRWYCTTCARVVDPDEADDIRYA
jgi:DNA-binding HxlR family transcriptional regulator